MIRYSRSAKALAICLAAMAGFVDAAGFLLTGGLFLSFMSGNSTRLAVAVTQGAGIAGLAAMLIVGFVLGVVGGSLLAAKPPHIRSKSRVLTAVAGLLALGALLDMSKAPWAAAMLLAMAMGCSNNVFVRDGDVTIGVTYMTGALVRLGQRLADALRGGPRWDWLPYLLLWGGLVSGATAGALSFKRLGPHCLWIAVAGALILAVWARRIQLREGR